MNNKANKIQSIVAPGPNFISDLHCFYKNADKISW